MRLRVFTLNVWGLPAPVGRHVPERLAAIAAHFPTLDCDLALFQEVWTEPARALLVEAGRAAGYEHVWHRSPARSGSGLLVLSRLPLHRPRFTPFALGGLPQRITHADYYAGKGFVLFDVDPGEGPVTVLDTHLHARYDPGVDEYVGHQAAEIIEIAAALRKVRNPLIAAGDFNVRPGSRRHRVLVELGGLVDAAATLGAPEATSTTDNPYRRGRAQEDSRIDYVFCRDGATRAARPVSVERVFDEPIEIAGAEGAYSDHAGVLAAIEIGSRPRPEPAPDPGAYALAAKLLEEGRAIAKRRRRNERVGAAAAAAGGGAAFWAATRGRIPLLTRRVFLRGALHGGAGLALLAAGGLTLLSERYVADELSAYDELDALLAALASESHLPPGHPEESGG